MSEAHAKQTIAVFDFDGTMVKGDSIISFVRYAIARGKLSPLALPGILLHGLGAVLGLVSMEQAKGKALRFLSRMDASQQRGFHLAFCREKLLPSLLPDAVKTLEAHRARGDRLLILSASTDNYMQPLKELLGLDAVLATPTDEQGVVTENLRGRRKPLRMLSWAAEQPYDIDWPESSAYGNSRNDLPLLELFGKAYMVNPKAAMVREGKGLPELHWS